VLAHCDCGKLLFVIGAIWQKATDGVQVETWTVCEDARRSHEIVNAGDGYVGDWGYVGYVRAVFEFCRWLG
tara:strand:- start:1660 stop:1872 length:213 start_codon:yes stop_codon:yes gene_type:complete